MLSFLKAIVAEKLGFNGGASGDENFRFDVSFIFMAAAWGRHVDRCWSLVAAVRHAGNAKSANSFQGMVFIAAVEPVTGGISALILSYNDDAPSPD
ncbi:hypothetical protein CCGE531_12790 [Rhizobium sp. CCGE531]|nr:hypothetical protein CCGE531_12790 [Rhizobium sp. CCGE531]AYG73160.1 hypothetical protein CCGE532_12210 [Rhizobium sp. CCGE532]